jgi:hypothetical protein
MRFKPAIQKEKAKIIMWAGIPEEFYMNCLPGSNMSHT